MKSRLYYAISCFLLAVILLFLAVPLFTHRLYPKQQAIRVLHTMEKGEQLDASAYLDYIEEGGETFAVSGITSSVEGTSESEQQSTASKQISMENIEITSKVDTEKSGVYTVNYHYTSEETGYDCNANLIVVVE